MASSILDICNLALAHLGEGAITALEDDTVAARACALHFPTVRDALLRARRWNFAQTRAVLSLLADAPAFGWDYQYSLPADCLRVLEVNDSEFGDVVSEEFIIEGRAILTDASAVNLVYTKRVDDVAQFDPLFVEALAVKLAIKLTESIRGTTGKTAELVQMFERITGPLAGRVDANEGKRRRGLLPLNSHAVRARGGI